MSLSDTTNHRLHVAVVYNQKRNPPPGMPEDFYAEFDNIVVPTAIKASLERGGNHVSLLEADESLYQKLREYNIGFVFNIAEGLHGESRESQVPAMLEMLRIPYTGSGILTQAITLDKKRTKEILLFNGIRTPKFQLVSSPLEQIALDYPLFVKPNSEGSSKGIRNNSLVHDERELHEQIRFVTETYHEPALVEEYLDGREFTISILGNPGRVLPIVEVTFDYLPPGINKIDSYEVKWFYDSPSNPIDPVKCPAQISTSLEKEISDAAIRTYNALGCQDLARVDMRLDSHGRPNVIEVNALPGLIPDPKENSRFPRACYTAGMDYDDMILTIFNSAMTRYGLQTVMKEVRR